MTFFGSRRCTCAYIIRFKEEGWKNFCSFFVLFNNTDFMPKLKFNDFYLNVRHEDYKVNQTKTNLQKYFHPSSSNHLIYAHVQCRDIKKFKEDGRAEGTTPLGVTVLGYTNNCLFYSWLMARTRVIWLLRRTTTPTVIHHLGRTTCVLLTFSIMHNVLRRKVWKIYLIC